MKRSCSRSVQVYAHIACVMLVNVLVMQAPKGAASQSTAMTEQPVSFTNRDNSVTLAPRNEDTDNAWPTLSKRELAPTYLAPALPPELDPNNAGVGKTIPAYATDPDNQRNLRLQSQFRSWGLNEFADVLYDVEVEKQPASVVPVAWLRLSGITGFADFVQFFYQAIENIMATAQGDPEPWDWGETLSIWNLSSFFRQPRENEQRAGVLTGYRTQGPGSF